MPETLNSYFVPTRGHEEKPSIVLTKAIGSLVVGSESTITVEGTSFDTECQALIYAINELPETVPFVENVYKSPTQCQFAFTPTQEIEYQIRIINGDQISDPISIFAIAPITVETTTEELQSRGIVLLSDLDKLKIGNNPAKKNDLDLLYYRNVSPIQADNGAYITKKGYFVFPQLVSNQSEKKVISFIFYSGNDRNYLVFGYCSEERYNFASNDYNKTELSLRFRNQSGCYYQQGLFESGRSSFTYQGYIDFDYGYFYRLDIPVGGTHFELSCLKDGEIANWFGGKSKQKVQLTTAPDLTGETLYPYFGNYNGSKSPLLGVAIS